MTRTAAARASLLACVALVVACGGHDFARWGGLIAGLESYARAEDCARIEIAGRPGWLRRLPGYRLAKIVIAKEL